MLRNRKISIIQQRRVRSQKSSINDELDRNYTGDQDFLTSGDMHRTCSGMSYCVHCWFIFFQILIHTFVLIVEKRLDIESVKRL